MYLSCGRKIGCSLDTPEIRREPAPGMYRGGSPSLNGPFTMRPEASARNRSTVPSHA
jgi:hypothetical protein